MASIILFSILSPQQLCEIGEAEGMRPAQGHPASFYSGMGVQTWFSQIRLTLIILAS